MIIHNEKLDSILSYSIGGTAITLPMLVDTITTGIQFLTMLGGFVIVVFRIIYEYNLYKKNKSE